MGLMPPNARRVERAEKKRSLITTIVFGLLFVGWVGEWPREFDSIMYDGHWRSVFVVFGPLFTPVPGISLFPWQLLLIALAPFCLGTSSPARRHAREMDQAILISIVCIAVTFLWGLVRGGSAYFAYYQVWRFMAGLLLAYMLMSVVRSERDLVTLGKLVTLAALIRATLCIYFYWAQLHGRIDPEREYVTNHDDTMLFVAATLIVVIWAFHKGGSGPWRVAALVVPYLFYAVVLNQRRIAWVELSLSVPAMYFLLGAGPARSRINRWAMWLAPVAVIYFVAGMGSSSGLFAPVHALMTTGSNYDPSSVARKEEIRNLLRTLVDIGNPIFGTGWGRPYDKVETFYANFDQTWTLYLYTPHNSLLGLAAYTGLVGIVGIWGVVPMGAYLAARGYRGSTDPVPRAAAMVALGSLAAYSVHCYGDVGLQSFAGALLFGVALATAGKVAAWSAAPSAVQSVTTRAAAGRLPFEPQARYRKAGALHHGNGPPSQRSGSSAKSGLRAAPGRASRLPR